MNPPSAARDVAPSPSRRDLLGLGAGLAVAGAGIGCAAPPSMEENQEAPAPDSGVDSLDELLSDLTDQRGHHTPISTAERTARAARLGRLLAEAGVDALLLEPGSTFSYLTEVSWGLSERFFGLVVFADGSSMWVAPRFEVPRAEEAIAAAGGPHGPVLGWDEHEHAFAPLAAALTARGVQRIAVEPRTRVFVWTELAAALGPEAVVPGDDVVRALRGVKDAHELALLRAASELTQRAVVAVAERLTPGMTDHEVGALMRRAQERLGLRGVWVLPLLGEDAAMPHGGPTGRVLTPGESILVDTGGSLFGYQSDTTRSWIFAEKPSAEYERAWHTVREAQRAAFAALRPGAPGGDADRAARQVISGAGYGEGYTVFTHRLGHGIGMDGHEEPYLDGGNARPLAPGMTFSNEPGIYLPGRFGIRLEDVMVVTEDGADHFGTWAVDPRSPA